MNETPSAGPVVIAGGTGFLGTSLADHFTSLGRNVVLLSRSAPRTVGNFRYVAWDARTLGSWVAALDGASAIINLVGRSVDCIKTTDHQYEIVRSRVEATRVLGAAMRVVDRPPPVWVQMSTAHIYGDPPHVICDEDSALGYGFAPDVGRAWEEEFQKGVLPSQRTVVLRTSFVIGRDRGAGSGALSRLCFLVRFGLGGQVGSGTQGMSWIHETDLNRLFECAITDSTMQGVYIASSPNPVSQTEFMRTLRRSMKASLGLPASEWMVRIGARLFLKADPDLALYGRYVVSKRLRDGRFQFHFPDLEQALTDLISVPLAT